jgi:hypothetical protein
MEKLRRRNFVTFTALAITQDQGMKLQKYFLAQPKEIAMWQF